MTIAHEFHHAIQFGYYATFDGSWWQESTSTWMEEVAYPHIDDYLQYLTYFLGEPQRALNSGVFRSLHTYGTAIFSFFLEQRYGPALEPLLREELQQHSPEVIALRARTHLNRLIWEEVGQRRSVDLDSFRPRHPPSRAGRTRRCYGRICRVELFHRQRATKANTMPKGTNIPTVPTRDIAVAAEAVVRDTSLDQRHRQRLSAPRSRNCGLGRG